MSRRPTRAASVHAIAAIAAIAATAATAACSSATSAKPGATPAAEAQATTKAASAITFIDDDYPRALAEAKRTKRPLFIDAWAPWCHTCLSMRAYVFGDPALAPLASNFVWLAIDTEKPENAPVMAKYPIEAWPTLWVVDPEREAPVLKWLGAATAPELALLLDDAAAAVGRRDAGGEAGAAFVRAKQATAAGKQAEAIAEYRAALATAPADWKRRPQVAEALAAALQGTNDRAACVSFARAELPRLPPGTSRANVALAGLACASDRPGAGDSAARTELAAAVRRIAEDRADPILPDDRSGLYEALVSLYDEAHDRAAAAETARAWATFLEGEAAAAKTPEARAVFDAHRVLANVALGEPARALPMLLASERDFPGDYNPPARLAGVYLKLGRLDEALAAVDRALARVYGGRELRVRALKADIQLARGDRDGAAATLREAIARAAKSDLPPNYKAARESLAKRLETIERGGAVGR